MNIDLFRRGKYWWCKGPSLSGRSIMTHGSTKALSYENFLNIGGYNERSAFQKSKGQSNSGDAGTRPSNVGAE